MAVAGSVGWFLENLEQTTVDEMTASGTDAGTIYMARAKCKAAVTKMESMLANTPSPSRFLSARDLGWEDLPEDVVTELWNIIGELD